MSSRDYWESDCGTVKLWLGDCLDVMRSWPDGAVDAVVTDPPYGDTQLPWDVREAEWIKCIAPPHLWCFGSMRYWMRSAAAFEAAGWKYAEEVVWEKHNGSSFAADRFRRVHEFAVHWYRGMWSDLYVNVPVTYDAAARVVCRSAGGAAHTGHRDESRYATLAGGARLMRSVQHVRSCHGHAEHPTQKPIGVIDPLIRASVAPGGTTADPFMGSGTTGVAAVRLGRRFWGVEIDPEYFETAKRRIREELRVAAFVDPDRFAPTQMALPMVEDNDQAQLRSGKG